MLVLKNSPEYVTREDSELMDVLFLFCKRLIAIYVGLQTSMNYETMRSLQLKWQ